MLRLSYHRAVQQEIDNACHWYDERKSNLGDEFFRELEELLNRIASRPEAFPLAPSGRRRANMKRFPYAVSYRVLADRVRILCIHHERRDTSYGAGRV
jgi:toxin ParE1/3/4